MGTVVKQNVGIDVSKDDFKVCFSMYSAELRVKVKGTHTFRNTEKGFAEFHDWSQSKRQTEWDLHVTMEATGVYYEGLAYYLHERHYKVHVVLPNQSKSYGKSLGVKSKTDKIDARILGQMGLERELRQWQPLSSNFRVLKQLTRERDSLVRERTIASNQKHAYSYQGKPHKDSIDRCVKHISLLNEQIKEIEIEIKKIVEGDKLLCSKLKYLQSIPGIGLLTAVTIVSETNGFAVITSIKQLTSYAGLDIKIQESGIWKGKSKISKIGNRYIRKILYMPALCTVKHNNKTAQFYQRLKDKKGTGMIANVAVQRKLLALVYTLWKKEEMFSDKI
jgi:transposase